MATRISFLSLPAEIRNHIYGLSGIVHKTRIMITAPRDKNAKPRPQVKEPIIALACRQVRSEVLGIFYSQNVFGCQTRKDLRTFLQHLPPSNLNALRKIQWAKSNRITLSRVRYLLTHDLKPFLHGGLRAHVVAGSIQVKNEGKIWVTAADISNFKQSGSGVSRSDIIRVKRA